LIDEIKSLAEKAGVSAAEFAPSFLVAPSPSASGAASPSASRKHSKIQAPSHVVPAILRPLLAAAIARHKASKGDSSSAAVISTSVPEDAAAAALPWFFPVDVAFPTPDTPPKAEGLKQKQKGSTRAPLLNCSRDLFAEAAAHWRGLSTPQLAAERAARERFYPIEDAAVTLEPSPHALREAVPDVRTAPPPVSCDMRGLSSTEYIKVLQVRHTFVHNMPLRSLRPSPLCAPFSGSCYLQVWDFARVFASGMYVLEFSPDWCGDQLVVSSGGRWVQVVSTVILHLRL
jgi:hypothetical protein